MKSVARPSDVQWARSTRGLAPGPPSPTHYLHRCPFCPPDRPYAAATAARDAASPRLLPSAADPNSFIGGAETAPNRLRHPSPALWPQPAQGLQPSPSRSLRLGAAPHSQQLPCRVDRSQCVAASTRAARLHIYRQRDERTPTERRTKPPAVYPGIHGAGSARSPPRRPAESLVANQTIADAAFLRLSASCNASAPRQPRIDNVAALLSRC